MPDDILRRNNVKISGRGTQPMLFAHGFGCDQNMWRYVTKAFEDDYRVILFDYVGAGQSDISAYDAKKYSTLGGYARDVLDIVRALDLREVVFVGHSVSSIIGVLAANQEPDRFARLILIGPSPRYINEDGYVGGFERKDIDGLFEMMDRNFIGWANFLAPAIMKNPERPELGQELSDSFCSTDPVIARNFAAATFLADNRSDLSKVSVPSLILQMSDDMVAPDAVGSYVNKAIANSTLRQMKATGHCPHMSHPDETIALIKEYLEAVSVGAE
jgi:sigma-B regulation protein RsbQ